MGKITAQDDDGDPITFRITNVEDSVQRTFEIAKETGTLFATFYPSNNLR